MINTKETTSMVELVQTVRRMGDHMHLNREKAHNAFKQLIKDGGVEADQVSIEMVKLMVNS
jgi:hypothetical protein